MSHLVDAQLNEPNDSEGEETVTIQVTATDTWIDRIKTRLSWGGASGETQDHDLSALAFTLDRPAAVALVNTLVSELGLSNAEAETPTGHLDETTEDWNWEGLAPSRLLQVPESLESRLLAVIESQGRIIERLMFPELAIANGTNKPHPFTDWTRADVEAASAAQESEAHQARYATERDHLDHVAELTLRQVHDILSLGGADVPEETIDSWTPDERYAAVRWASLEHLSASDNDDVETVPMPDFLAFRYGDKVTEGEPSDG